MTHTFDINAGDQRCIFSETKFYILYETRSKSKPKRAIKVRRGGLGARRQKVLAVAAS